MNEKIVLDTNVLLNRPSIIFELPKIHIFIPQTVINEIDKMKTARVDRQIKFNGREVSRHLFKLAERGSLNKGVKLKNGSTIQVVNINHNREHPESLNLRSPDDQIIAIASNLNEDYPDNKIIIYTSDLNMLLKAQSLGLRVHHYEAERKFKIINNFLNLISSNRRNLNAVALALVIILSLFAIYKLAISSNQAPSNVIGAPPKIQSQLETFKIKENEYLKIIDKNPKDLEALRGLGNLYYDNQQWEDAINAYAKYLEIEDDNNDVRTDMATAYHQLGINDIAIRELERVIRDEPDHAVAYYNLGIIFYGGERSPQNAKKMFEKYIEIAPNGTFTTQAKQFIEQLDERIKSTKTN